MKKTDYGINEKGEVVDECVTFNVKCTMRKRWAPHFIGMLKKMAHYGSMGCSREITFYSDGDGDFRPEFAVSDESIPNADPINDHGGHLYFDAG